MRVINIKAYRDTIEIITDATFDKTATVIAYSPALEESNELCRAKVTSVNGVFTVDRFNNEYDLIASLFKIIDEDLVVAEGKCYVEKLEYSERDFDYPIVDTKKGLQISNLEDAVALGVKHSALNASQGDFLLPEYVDGNTIVYKHNGRNFYFDESYVLRYDRQIKDLSDRGIIITLILLNSPKWHKLVPDSLWNVIKHPCYDKLQDGQGRISQFNVITNEGVAYYSAFISFLAERYTREDEKYGRIVGMIVGNEVNTGYVWCNAGPMTCEEYCRQYTVALRLTYLNACSVYKNMRIYISLDHFWSSANFDEDPLKYYPSRSVLENVNSSCMKDGQIPWNLAHHPYPEDLRFPDFWNDYTATDSLDTCRITFKNLELLVKVLEQPNYLFEGKRRRIILSEQGFNSHYTPESEILQAVAYGRAYKKVMQIPEIDSFILHAYRDCKEEFGLNLGLLRRKIESNEIDGPKPMYYVFKAIDKKDEKGVYHWERY